jgi:hypothetical protein
MFIHIDVRVEINVFCAFGSLREGQYRIKITFTTKGFRGMLDSLQFGIFIFLFPNDYNI